MSFGKDVLMFYRDLKITEKLPKGVEILNPYDNKGTFEICDAFYNKYYGDDLKRFLILGINPGRYGAGITGIPFADPVKLETLLGIKNTLSKKTELSADFVHSMIAAFGGPEKFFSHFFINSVSPLGFTRGGKNLNYYDDSQLRRSLEPFIQRSIERMLHLNIDRNVVFCLGEGQNLKYLEMLNEKNGFFKTIVSLAHPRYIMQYKRKHLAHYLDDYRKKLGSVL